MPLAFGAGTGFALQSTWLAGLPGAWMATPHVMSPPSAVHKGAWEADPSAGVARPRAHTKIAIGSRHTRASSHASDHRTPAACVGRKATIWARIFLREDRAARSRERHRSLHRPSLA